jgi:hypothetical protein
VVGGVGHSFSDDDLGVSLVHEVIIVAVINKIENGTILFMILIS